MTRNQNKSKFFYKIIRFSLLDIDIRQSDDKKNAIVDKSLSVNYSDYGGNSPLGKTKLENIKNHNKLDLLEVLGLTDTNGINAYDFEINDKHNQLQRNKTDFGNLSEQDKQSHHNEMTRKKTGPLQENTNFDYTQENSSNKKNYSKNNILEGDDSVFEIIKKVELQDSFTHDDDFTKLNPKFENNNIFEDNVLDKIAKKNDQKPSNKEHQSNSSKFHNQFCNKDELQVPILWDLADPEGCVKDELCLGLTNTQNKMSKHCSSISNDMNSEDNLIQEYWKSKK